MCRALLHTHIQNRALWICRGPSRTEPPEYVGGPTYPQQSPPYPQKSPAHQPNSRIRPQKTSTHPQKQTCVSAKEPCKSCGISDVLKCTGQNKGYSSKHFSTNRTLFWTKPSFRKCTKKQGVFIVSNCYELLRIVTNCYELLRIVTNCYELLRIVTNCHELLRIVTNCYELSRIVTNCYELLRIVTNCYELLRIVTNCYDEYPLFLRIVMCRYMYIEYV